MTDAKRHAPRGRLKADPMSTAHPMGHNPMGHNPRCSAHSKQKGIQCGRTAIPGGTVCRYHGGLAPQVIQKAEERLKALIDPAITRLDQLVHQTEYPSVAIAAVKDVLDRNGALGKAKETQDVHISGSLNIVSRLRNGRQRVEAEALKP